MTSIVRQLDVEGIVVWQDSDGEWWVRCPHREKGFCWKCESEEAKCKAMWAKAKLQEDIP